jgi:hypothetical protein
MTAATESQKAADGVVAAALAGDQAAFPVFDLLDLPPTR